MDLRDPNDKDSMRNSMKMKNSAFNAKSYIIGMISSSRRKNAINDESKTRFQLSKFSNLAKAKEKVMKSTKVRFTQKYKNYF